MIKILTTPDIYEHFKGGRYVVIGEAQHTETLEILVLYQDYGHDHSPTKTWARPRDMFYHDGVEVDGKKVARFKKVGFLSRDGRFISSQEK